MVALATLHTQLTDRVRVTWYKCRMQFKALVLLVPFMLAACVTPGPGPKPGPAINAVIDCTVDSKDQIASLLNEFRPLVSGQAPDWAAVYERAKDAGKTIGGCALAELVQEYLGNRGTPPTVTNGQTANKTFEDFRHQVAGDATFHTSAGDL